MFRQWLSAWLALVVALGMAACRPQGTAYVDDDQNPFIVTGLQYKEGMEYDMAIKAFERALEKNPNSVRAHYELGLLYEKNKNEYVNAIYHYNRVLKLQPTGYPADNVRLLIDGCRQELVKTEKLAPVTQAIQNEVEQLRNQVSSLREENNQLTAQLRALSRSRAGGAATTSPPDSPSQGAPISAAERTGPQPGAGSSASIETGQTQDRVSGRTHAVRRGETFYSIARLYRVDVKKLIAANPGVAPSSLPSGYILRIP